MIVKRLLLCFICCILAASPLAGGRCLADLRPMSEADMAAVSGSGGISIGIGHLAIYMHTGSFSYTDTDTGNSLVLENLIVTDGFGRPARWNVGNVDTDGDGLRSPLTLDVGAIAETLNPGTLHPVLALRAQDWSQQVMIQAGALRFAGQELGTLDIGPIDRPSWYWMVGPHLAGAGIDFEHGLTLSVTTLRLKYNPTESFCLNGIHLAGSSTGAPEDPSIWQMSGLFKIGDIAAGNPATFDVGDNGSGSAAVVVNLPMQGSLRVEKVLWAGNEFGPIAIDGIQVHRMRVSFTP